MVSMNLREGAGVWGSQGIQNAQKEVEERREKISGIKKSADENAAL